MNNSEESYEIVEETVTVEKITNQNIDVETKVEKDTNIQAKLKVGNKKSEFIDPSKLEKLTQDQAFQKGKDLEIIKEQQKDGNKKTEIKITKEHQEEIIPKVDLNYLPFDFDNASMIEIIIEREIIIEIRRELVIENVIEIKSRADYNFDQEELRKSHSLKNDQNVSIQNKDSDEQKVQQKSIKKENEQKIEKKEIQTQQENEQKIEKKEILTQEVNEQKIEKREILTQEVNQYKYAIDVKELFEIKLTEQKFYDIQNPLNIDIEIEKQKHKNFVFEFESRKKNPKKNSQSQSESEYEEEIIEVTEITTTQNQQINKEIQETTSKTKTNLFIGIQNQKQINQSSKQNDDQIKSQKSKEKRINPIHQTSKGQRQPNPNQSNHKEELSDYTGSYSNKKKFSQNSQKSKITVKDLDENVFKSYSSDSVSQSYQSSSSSKKSLSNRQKLRLKRNESATKNVVGMASGITTIIGVALMIKFMLVPNIPVPIPQTTITVQQSTSMSSTKSNMQNQNLIDQFLERTNQNQTKLQTQQKTSIQQNQQKQSIQQIDQSSKNVQQTNQIIDQSAKNTQQTSQKGDYSESRFHQHLKNQNKNDIIKNTIINVPQSTQNQNTVINKTTLLNIDQSQKQNLDIDQNNQQNQDQQKEVDITQQSEQQSSEISNQDISDKNNDKLEIKENDINDTTKIIQEQQITDNQIDQSNVQDTNQQIQDQSLTVINNNQQSNINNLIDQNQKQSDQIIDQEIDQQTDLIEKQDENQIIQDQNIQQEKTELDQQIQEKQQLDNTNNELEQDQLQQDQTDIDQKQDQLTSQDIANKNIIYFTIQKNKDIHNNNQTLIQQAKEDIKPEIVETNNEVKHEQIQETNKIQEQTIIEKQKDQLTEKIVDENIIDQKEIINDQQQQQYKEEIDTTNILDQKKEEQNNFQTIVTEKTQEAQNDSHKIIHYKTQKSDEQKTSSEIPPSDDKKQITQHININLFKPIIVTKDLGQNDNGINKEGQNKQTNDVQQNQQQKQVTHVHNLYFKHYIDVTKDENLNNEAKNQNDLDLTNKLLQHLIDLQEKQQNQNQQNNQKLENQNSIKMNNRLQDINEESEFETISLDSDEAQEDSKENDQLNNLHKNVIINQNPPIDKQKDQNNTYTKDIDPSLAPKENNNKTIEHHIIIPHHITITHIRDNPFQNNTKNITNNQTQNNQLNINKNEQLLQNQTNENNFNSKNSKNSNKLTMISEYKIEHTKKKHLQDNTINLSERYKNILPSTNGKVLQTNQQPVVILALDQNQSSQINQNQNNSNLSHHQHLVLHNNQLISQDENDQNNQNNIVSVISDTKHHQNDKSIVHSNVDYYDMQYHPESKNSTLHKYHPGAYIPLTDNHDLVKQSQKINMINNEPLLIKNYNKKNNHGVEESHTFTKYTPQEKSNTNMSNIKQVNVIKGNELNDSVDKIELKDHDIKIHKNIDYNKDKAHYSKHYKGMLNHNEINNHNGVDSHSKTMLDQKQNASWTNKTYQEEINKNSGLIKENNLGHFEGIIEKSNSKTSHDDKSLNSSHKQNSEFVIDDGKFKIVGSEKENHVLGYDDKEMGYTKNHQMKSQGMVDDTYMEINQNSKRAYHYNDKKSSHATQSVKHVDMLDKDSDLKKREEILTIRQKEKNKLIKKNGLDKVVTGHIKGVPISQTHKRVQKSIQQPHKNEKEHMEIINKNVGEKSKQQGHYKKEITTPGEHLNSEVKFIINNDKNKIIQKKLQLFIQQNYLNYLQLL